MESTVQSAMPGAGSFAKQISGKWGWLVAAGFVFTLLGMIGLGMATAVSELFTLYFGILLIIGGVVEFFHAFKSRLGNGLILEMLIGILYIVAGAWAVSAPLQAMLTLTFLIGCAFLASGILRMIMAFQMRSHASWGAVLFGAILSVILGLMIINEWPESSLWVIGTLISVEMIIYGVSLLMVGFGMRGVHKTLAT
ncbi:MAG: HdeD family acid-resistance protein [Planctomycetota bacterium]|nr:HdeD family acid-resistance protein [Planctomycetota bacterium]